MRNIYEIGNVQFWHTGGGKWHVRAPMGDRQNFVKIVSGKENAEAIAKALNASVTRLNKRPNIKLTVPVDGLCHARFNQLGV